ncbi:alpha/beta hydrolase [Sphingomonas sp. CGMCC 1.13654]|uniref:Alpha/beta hydrolase n=1 Tax=Sphingomonas chungangi TaxID=2683589 RepID=A0A838L6L3_9SPHN|nr:alpha/beta hydrolase [Sphingomonas chungangi]MBA2934292.1 alpha/beta hydrolase [Sphingomonas chungangi]MVW57333.1 alpha/beta hydrolase [Sphingomonas chungangi]
MTDWPLCLMVPGIGNSGRGHWQTAWERDRPDCVHVDLGCWEAPIRNVWLSRIDQAVAAAGRPVVLAAHGLGCHAVAWWAALLGKAASRRVCGALLVAPPDPAVDFRLGDFAPVPTAMLPFPSIVVASRDDPAAGLGWSRELAGEWMSDFAEVGEAGHLNARSRLGDWAQGQRLLDMLIDGGPGLSRYPYRREQPSRPARPVRPSLRVVTPAR